MTLSPLSYPPSPSSKSCDDSNDFGYCAQHHLQAQILNNAAATCIENGQQNYEKAISILAKALRICEREKEQEHEHAYDVCSCHYCSIDSCIVLSSDDDDHDNDDGNDIDEGNNDGSSIYQNPIYVYEGHNMGSTLIQIIAFNLAIVHHLTAMVAANNDNEIENESIIIEKALQFYEFACECNLSNTCNIRFDTIICNNLSHIYRYQEQTEEQHEVKHQHQQEKQQQEKHKQSITTDLEDDNDDDSISSLGMNDLIEFEYYSQEKEQEEYEHNVSLVHCSQQYQQQHHRLLLLHIVAW